MMLVRLDALLHPLALVNQVTISLILMASFLALPGWVAAVIPPADSVRIESIKALISTHQIRTVAELLPWLPKSFRSRYVLMHQSESLQQGSPLAPRVILFTPDAKFVMTFNGDASQYGFEAIETMSFASDGPMKDKFVFEEIVFPKDLEARIKYLNDQNAFDEAKKLVRDHQNPNRIGPNARVCLGCHKKDPRPNWNQGDQWPGAYGKIQDTIWNQKMPGTDPASGEVVQFEDFLEMRTFPQFAKLASRVPRDKNPTDKHPRYQHVLLQFPDSKEDASDQQFRIHGGYWKIKCPSSGSHLERIQVLSSVQGPTSFSTSGLFRNQSKPQDAIQFLTNAASGL